MRYTPRCTDSCNWSVSKVKSIELDIFFDYEIDLLLTHLGNDVAMRIWEESINRGIYIKIKRFFFVKLK